MAGQKQKSIKTSRSSSILSPLMPAYVAVVSSGDVVCISMLHKVKDVQPISELRMLMPTMSSLDITSSAISSSKSKKQNSYDHAYVAPSSLAHKLA